MDIHTDFINSSTPAVSRSGTSFWKTGDSGYTSFTPGSVEYSDISSKNLNSDTADETPEGSCRLPHVYKPRNVLSSTENVHLEDSPTVRRGVKRSHQDVVGGLPFNTVPTPTTLIAGSLKRLKVTENTPHSVASSVSLSKSVSLDSGVCELYQLPNYTNGYPSTPVKKICQSSCKLSPMKRSAKKLTFAIHPLSCASSGLQPVNKKRPHSKVARTIQFKPEKKLDILKLLFQRGVHPPLKTIFSFLSNEDICNVKLTSDAWCHIWNEITTCKVKNDHFNYLKNVRENLENRETGLSPKSHEAIETGLTPKSHEASQVKVLKEVHNVLNVQTIKENMKSPPGTPRTNKFRKFTKSASLDSRLQLLCVRCAQPAKVTRESSGEEWAECTSSTCAFQFCRACNCDRHPGKSCIRYDLDGPSPSKRKKAPYMVGSKKSRKNLRRLL